MNKTIFAAIVAVLVLLVGGYVFFQRSQNQTSLTPTSTNVTSPSSAPESTSSSQTGQIKEFTVTGSSYKFDPALITINKGDKVRITFTDSGGTHDLVINGLNVQTKILSSNQSETVEFTADKSGTFDYYCSVDGHRALGMVGKLVVQ